MVRTGGRQHPVLCLCQLGYDSATIGSGRRAAGPHPSPQPLWGSTYACSCLYWLSCALQERRGEDALRFRLALPGAAARCCVNARGQVWGVHMSGARVFASASAPAEGYARIQNAAAPCGAHPQRREPPSANPGQRERPPKQDSCVRWTYAS